MPSDPGFQFWSQLLPIPTADSSSSVTSQWVSKGTGRRPPFVLASPPPGTCFRHGLQASLLHILRYLLTHHSFLRKPSLTIAIPWHPSPWLGFIFLIRCWIVYLYSLFPLAGMQAPAEQRLRLAHPIALALMGNRRAINTSGKNVSANVWGSGANAQRDRPDFSFQQQGTRQPNNSPDAKFKSWIKHNCGAKLTRNKIQDIRKANLKKEP